MICYLSPCQSTNGSDLHTVWTRISEKQEKVPIPYGKHPSTYSLIKCCLFSCQISTNFSALSKMIIVFPKSSWMSHFYCQHNDFSFSEYIGDGVDIIPIYSCCLLKNRRDIRDWSLFKLGTCKSWGDGQLKSACETKRTQTEQNMFF